MAGIVITLIISLAVGLIAGYFLGVFHVRKQLEQMQKDPKMIQEMARKMGVNLNTKQMNKAQQMLNKKKFR